MDGADAAPFKLGAADGFTAGESKKCEGGASAGKMESAAGPSTMDAGSASFDPPDLLERMHKQLETTLSSKGGSSAAAAAGSSSGRAVTSVDPELRVVKWVDYTSKYGMGYLNIDGSCGVYFNDATKIILSSDGVHLEYMERVSRRASAALISNPPRHRHTLSDYPSTMEKKVTLLKHFKNYLVAQQTKKRKEGEVPTSEENRSAKRGGPASSMVYVKKWVRTRHAILFRLSNKTVQVTFFDKTEVILLAEAKQVTFINKQRERQTYSLESLVSEVSCGQGRRKGMRGAMLAMLLVALCRVLAFLSCPVAV